MSPAEIEAGSRREIELERECAQNPNTYEQPKGEDILSETTKGI